MVLCFRLFLLNLTELTVDHFPDSALSVPDDQQAQEQDRRREEESPEYEIRK